MATTTISKKYIALHTVMYNSELAYTQHFSFLHAHVIKEPYNTDTPAM